MYNRFVNITIIVFFFPDLQVAYLSAALSCEIIFTFIRREEITKAQVREEIMSGSESFSVT